MEPVTLFKALGDPIRLEMIRRLSSGQPYTLTTISKDLDLSRQGIRKHIQVLADAQLVSLKPQGRETEVLLLRGTLDQGKTFIMNLERGWDKRLDAFRRFVEDPTK